MKKKKRLNIKKKSYLKKHRKVYRILLQLRRTRNSKFSIIKLQNASV